MLEKELTSIERFAVAFLEHQMAPLNTEELEKADVRMQVVMIAYSMVLLEPGVSGLGDGKFQY